MFRLLLATMCGGKNDFGFNRENRLVFMKKERADFDYPEQGIRHGVEREIQNLKFRNKNQKTKLVESGREKEEALLRSEELYREKLAAEKMARVDQLTEVPNRRAFDEIMEKETERSKRGDHPLVFMIVDIDHFKVVNDIEGHEKGNMVLRDVAQILKQNIRKGDTVARIGGEEFGIILADTDLAQAERVAEKLLQAVRDGTKEKEEYKPVTISGGYALFGKQQTADKKLLEASADLALQDAKREGRNRMLCHQVGRKTSPEALRKHVKAHVKRVVPKEMDLEGQAQMYRELLAEAERKLSEKSKEKTGTDV